MSDYIVPRSVKKLEDEIEALEKEWSSKGQAPQEVDEEEEEVEEQAQEQEVEQASPEPVSKEEESFKKRYADLRRHSQKLADELKEVKEALKVKKSAGLPTAEEAAAWAEANPKAAAIIRAIALHETSASSDELSAIKDRLSRAEQEARIRKAHPDFEEVTSEDSDFHDWAETQPKSVQNLIYSADAEDVIWAIGQYKATKAPKTNVQKEAALAVSPRSKTPAPTTKTEGRFSESQVQAMSLAEFEKNETAILASQRNGSFIYDLSGAAR
jgi:DNA repair exonuclease SbcCD ATPase subunit